MARRSGTVLGPLLIVLGLLMLLPQLGFPGFGFLWPMLILAVGVGLLLRYFQTKDDSGFIFTGTLLVLLGAFFQLFQWFDFPMRDNWPFFVLAPGLAMLTMASIDRNRRDGLLPAGILIGLSLLFYLFSSGFFHQLFRGLFALLRFVLRIGVPVGLVALGAWLLFGRRRGLGHENQRGFPEKVEPRATGPAAWAGAATGAAVGGATEVEPIEAETVETDQEADFGTEESPQPEDIEEPSVETQDTDLPLHDVPEASDEDPETWHSPGEDEDEDPERR